MSNTNNESNIYPIGKFVEPEKITQNDILQAIISFDALPEQLKEFCDELNDEQLFTPYRENGWTIAQVIHHIADSHTNMYIRFKLALTTDNPTILSYDENKWAALPDAQEPDVNESLYIIHGINHRLVKLLRYMEDVDFKKTYFHPQYQKTVSLYQVTLMYAWHGDHHFAQIKHFAEKQGWV
jgi:hypothetical protein